MLGIESLPNELQSNAYRRGDTSAKSHLEGTNRWTLRNSPPEIRPYLKPTPRDLTNWRDPRVGWGLVLLDAGENTPDASDAPHPIRELSSARGGRVFRYAPGADGFRYLIDHANRCAVSISSSPLGISEGCLPYYLLIYGSPREIPWTLQYVLNAGHAVGRLSLEREALDNYIYHLLHCWESEEHAPLNSLVWSTAHSPDDITTLVNDAVAKPLHEHFAHDASSDFSKAILNSGAEATAGALIASLTEYQPRLIITTSHGATPDIECDGFGDILGAPVDHDMNTVQPATLADCLKQSGSIWYAHACCSAGSDDVTLFKSLFANGSEMDQILNTITANGPTIAPLPTALLSAGAPLKAFIAHVEPTFDWSLKDPSNGQRFGAPLITALYENLCGGAPVGHALRALYNRLAGLYSSYDANLRAYNESGSMLASMFYDLLVARDIQSTVILGDPTVTLK